MSEPVTLSLRAWQRLSTIDRLALLSMRRLQLPWMTSMMRSFTRLGDASSWTLITLALAASGKEGLTTAKLVGGSTLVAALIAQVLKRRLKRPRPSATLEGFVALAENPDAFSFPSGHSAAAFAAAVALAGFPDLGPWVLALACCIAVARVYLGAHYPLDVAVGIVLGVLSGIATRAAVGA
jgi:undecaprenyl-diphosphatase